jgi:hypothetical protein
LIFIDSETLGMERRRISGELQRAHGDPDRVAREAGDLLPPPDVEIVLESSGDGRSASLRALSDPGDAA